MTGGAAPRRWARPPVAGFGHARSRPRRRAARRPIPAGGCSPPTRLRAVRPTGHRWRHHRGRGGAGCRQPWPQDRPGGEGRLRLRHVVEVVQDGPRRSALPPTGRVPAGLREPGRAPATAGQCPPPGHAPPLSHPALREGRRGQPQCGPRLPDGTVALRPHRRYTDRQAPREGVTGPGPGPHADPPRRPSGGRLPLLGRQRRRRPADPCRDPHRRARPWRRGGQPHAGRRPQLRPHRPGGRSNGGTTGVRAVRRPRLGRDQCRRCVGRRGPRPRREPQSALHPAGQGHPRHHGVRGLPLRHRRRHPRQARPPVDLRRVVGGTGLPRHHRHRVGRAARRP